MGFGGGFKQGKPSKALLELKEYVSIKEMEVKYNPSKRFYTLVIIVESQTETGL